MYVLVPKHLQWPHRLCLCLQLVEWFAENYKTFGATLEFVTNKSQEGSQFVNGFGGIGDSLPALAVVPLAPLAPSSLFTCPWCSHHHPRRPPLVSLSFPPLLPRWHSALQSGLHGA